jgi:hypothetical protein
MNSARRMLAGAGIQTSALAFGGYNEAPDFTGATEEYNGTSWTSSPVSMSTIRGRLGGTGTQASALAFGGQLPNASLTAATEEWTGAGAPLTVTITAS